VTTAPNADVDAWEQILQQLEDDLARAESCLGPAPDISADTWTPPVAAPPLPEELLPRALDLLARQEAVLAPLTAALEEIVELRGAVTPRAGATHAPVRAAFLDIRA
jgi:hypothetical protein